MKHKHLVASVVLSALFSIPVQAQSTFPDVPDNHWAAAAVKKLAEAGIVEGFPNAPEERAAANIGLEKIALNVVQVKKALGNNAGLSGINITVDALRINAAQDADIIALRGTVKNAAQKKLAESIAQKSAPDARIINNLKVVAPKTTKAKAKPQKAVKRAA